MTEFNARSRAGQTTNSLRGTEKDPLTSNGHASSGNNGHHSEETLSREVLGSIEFIAFIWLNRDDVRAAEEAVGTTFVFDCFEPDDITKTTIQTSRQIVVVTQDDDELEPGVNEVVQKCLERGAAKVSIWPLPGFGPLCPTMREWCQHYDLARVIVDLHYSKYEKLIPCDTNPLSPVFTEDPKRLKLDLIPVPPLRKEMIPGPLRAWVVDVGMRAHIPIDYTAAAVMVALSSLIGSRLAIRPKRRDRWLVVPNLWGAAVGTPGALKSPMVEEGLRPLKRLGVEAAERYEAEKVGWRASKLVVEAKKRHAEERLKKLAKAKAGDDEMEEVAREAIADDGEVEPREHRFIVNDVTIEKLQVFMAENPHGLLYYRDELTGLLTTMDKQGHETDRKFFLESWVGMHPYRIGRMGRDDVDIPRACLSIFGTIQPGPLAAYLKGAASGREADGFMPRFQVVVYPDPYPEFTYVDEYPDVEAKDWAFKVFQAIKNLNPEELGCEPDDDLKIPSIGFDDEAQQFFATWLTELETRLRKEPMSVLMESLLAKHRSLMPSFALMIHLVNLVNATGKITALPPVSVRAAGLAASWCAYLEGHAKRLYQAATDGDPTDAKTITDKIRTLPNPFKIRDVQRKGWSGLRSSDDVRRAVEMLEDRGWVKIVTPEPTGAKGRPDSEDVWVNPRALQEPKKEDDADGEQPTVL
jgi:hypothetical protein